MKIKRKKKFIFLALITKRRTKKKKNCIMDGRSFEHAGKDETNETEKKTKNETESTILFSQQIFNGEIGVERHIF